jgi:hypothetical protein
LTQDLDLYQRLDIHRVSFFLPKLIEAGLERAIEEIVGRGIVVDAVLPGAAFDLTDESGWTEVHEAMFMAIEVAERLGATTMPTAGGSAHGQAYHWAVDRFARAIGPVVSAGRQRGCGWRSSPPGPSSPTWASCTPCATVWPWPTSSTCG